MRLHDPRSIASRGNSFSVSRRAVEGKASERRRKKPGRPNHQDAANLATRTGPVNTMAYKAVGRALFRSWLFASLKGPKSLLPPTVGFAMANHPAHLPRTLPRCASGRKNCEEFSFYLPSSPRDAFYSVNSVK